MKELLRKLEIEDLEELAYFEAFCSLMEHEDEIDEETFYDLLTGLEFDTLLELMDAYLEEIIVGVPDDSIDLYTLLSSYKRSINGFLKRMEKENNRGQAISEIYRFRKWYAEEKLISCVNKETGESDLLSLCGALILGRLERLAVGKYEFDFSDCLEFEYEEYEDETDNDLSEMEDLYESETEDPNITLIDKEYPVIDGENYEEEEGEGWLQ